jgi:hypothetical protein
MTRNWIVTASRTLRIGRISPTCRRRCGTSPRLENLEGRLSLSSFSAGVGPVTAIVGNHIGTNAMVQGGHIGSAMDVVARKH